MSVIECECSMSYDARRRIGRERKPHSLLTGDYLYQDADILNYEELMNKQKQNQDTVKKKNIPEIEDKNEVKTTNTNSLGNQVVTQMSRNSIPPQLKRYGENAVTSPPTTFTTCSNLYGSPPPLIVYQTGPVDTNNDHYQNNSSKSSNKRKRHEDEYYPSKHSSNLAGEIHEQSHLLGNECSNDMSKSLPVVLQIGLANAIPCGYENQKCISVTLSKAHSSGNDLNPGICIAKKTTSKLRFTTTSKLRFKATSKQRFTTTSKLPFKGTFKQRFRTTSKQRFTTTSKLRFTTTLAPHYQAI